MSRHAPLLVEVDESGRLTISIGVETLKTAIEGGDRWVQGDSISDPDAFAAEVVRALEQEDAVGSTAVHLLFDRAAEEAIEAGAGGVELAE